MGQCISKNSEEDQKPDQSSSIKSPFQKHKSYSSKLLNPNINNVVIVEEDSCMNQSSLYSMLSCIDDPNAQPNRNTLINAFQKSRPLGATVTQRTSVKIINVSFGKKLHSHAIKCETGSKQHEVSLCNDQISEYDDWYIMNDKEKSIRDQNIIIIQHKLTRQLLKSSPNYLNKSKLQQVYCSDSMNDIQDEDYWQIEILSDTKKLAINSLIKLKHISSHGYLSGSKNKGTVKGHLEVCVLTNFGSDVWVVEEGK